MVELNTYEVAEVSGGINMLSAYAAIFAGDAAVLGAAGAVPTPASPFLFAAAGAAAGISAAFWLADAMSN
jgi:hypothetical protein